VNAGGVEQLQQFGAGTEKFSVVGKAWSKGVLNCRPGKAARSAPANWSRRALSSSGWRSMRPSSSPSSTAPNAAMPAMFSVPERQPASCPPPTIKGVNGAPARTYSMPMPLGA
jgi:hypothetical protein